MPSSAAVVCASALTAVIALCGCAADKSADGPALALGVAPSRPQQGTEGVFGEWVSQIIRTPAKDAAASPTYDIASIYDDVLGESRPVLALTLSDDGTFAIISNYSPTTRSIAFGTWSMTGNKVALEQNGDVAWVFVSLGGKLVADKDDGPTIILGRK